MSSVPRYCALLDARCEHVPGMDGLLLKEKAGGKSLLSHSIDRFDEDEHCSSILLLASPAVRDWVSTDPLTFASTKLRCFPGESSPAAALAELSEAVVVWHDALLPNWHLSLLDSLLRSWQPEGGCVPAMMLDASLGRMDGFAGSSLPADDAMQSIFGTAAPKAAEQHSLGELLDAKGLCLLETPQVYDRSALEAAWQDKSMQPLAAAHKAGLALILLPARPHNIRVADTDSLHLLRRLLGETRKSGKDRYGGLGW